MMILRRENFSSLFSTSSSGFRNQTSQNFSKCLEFIFDEKSTIIHPPPPHMNVSKAKPRNSFIVFKYLSRFRITCYQKLLELYESLNLLPDRLKSHYLRPSKWINLSLPNTIQYSALRLAFGAIHTSPKLGLRVEVEVPLFISVH